MKILYVSNGSNFLGAGGMEYHLLDITDWLNKKGVETALAIREGTFLHRNLLANKPNVYPLSWTGFAKLSSFWDVRRAIRDFSPDIVSINRERDIIRITLLVKLLGLFSRKRPKLVSVFHNSGWIKSHCILSRLDGIIFPNTFLRDIYLPGKNGTGINAKVIYHGIHLPQIDSTDKLNPDRERNVFKGRRFPIIGMIGELRKNQTELIDVALHVKRNMPDFTIAMVGRGSEKDAKELQDKIDRLDLTKHFILTGNVDKARMPEVYHDLDISVTTNRREPFGLAFLESLAAYTPLVAYDSGGPVEILEKGGGILVKGGPEEMAEQLCALLSNQEMRKAISLQGRAVVEKYFSIDAMGEGHFNFYRDLLKSDLNLHPFEK